MSGRNVVQMDARGAADEGAARFTFFAPADVLIPRVARQSIMSFCEGLRRVGVDVELVALRVRLRANEPTTNASIWDVYGIETPFSLVQLSSLLDQRTMDTRSGQVLTWLSRMVRYVPYAARKACRRRTRGDELDIFYCRNYGVARALTLVRALCGAGVRVVFEAHLPPRTRSQRRALRSVDGVVANTRRLASDLIAAGLIEHSRVLGEHQGVNLEQVESQRVDRTTARRLLGLPDDRRIVCYTGKVHQDSREVLLLVEAARMLPDDALMVILGGREDQVTALRSRIAQEGPANVVFPGFVAPSEVAKYHFAADALVLYYPSGLLLNDYRSPGKVFRYMASGTPIVACDIPVIHELLEHERSALLVPQNRSDLLAEEIGRLLDDPELGRALGRAARNEVESYTWEARACRVMAFARALPRR